jgi:hypothetical protein
MRKLFIVGLIALIGISVAAPSIAYAQELLPTADMAAPIALVTFGLLGLVSGAIGYLWRRRSTA